MSKGQSKALTLVSDLEASATCTPTAERRGKAQRYGGAWGARWHSA